MSMATPQRDADSNVRPDEDILEDVWAAVWQADTIHSSDLGNLSITVQQGAVVVSGHLASETNRWRIEACARAVPGVTVVRNDLVVDRELAVEVAQALSLDERTRPHLIAVGSSHGWVRLGGEVPCREAQLAAEEVAGQVPQVRGVIALPRVPGEGPAPARRAVQPRPGASVYGDNGQVGVVAQVVIDPRNRLVTHVVVHANETLDGKRGPGDYLVPIDVFDIVNVESLFLARGGSPSAAYPLVDPAVYPLAPSDWQPPYPYTAGDVRWPRRRLEAVENWPRPQRQPEWHLTDKPGAGRRTSGV
jgi:osmotically-inducible protein OsmY